MYQRIKFIIDAIMPNDSNLSFSIETGNIVSFNIEGFIFKTPIKKIRAILQEKLPILALTDIENKVVIIISLNKKDLDSLFVKSLKKGFEDTYLPKSKFENIISEWREILEKKYGIDKSLDELEELDEKSNRNVIPEKPDLIKLPPIRKYYGKTQADLDNEKKMQQNEILKREAEWNKVKNDEKKEYLEKKYGNKYTFEELEKMEEIDLELKSNREKEILRDLGKFEKDNKKLMRDLFD
jgi:hypothetical protein